MSDIIQNISEIFFAVPNYQNKKADNSDIAAQHSDIRNLSFHLLLSALFFIFVNNSLFIIFYTYLQYA